MRFKVLLVAAAIILPSFAVEAQEFHRWVPPPAPMVEEGAPIQVRAETNGNGKYIIHLGKPQQVDWRQTRYRVYLKGNDAFPLYARTVTSPFADDDEVSFITIPAEHKNDVSIEVVDESQYTHKKVYFGKIGDLKVIEN
jgi:hypothetical protein